MRQYSEQITKNTLVDYPRLGKIVDFVVLTANLPGDIAEVGVYKGGTAKLLTLLTTKRIYLFDTFIGMPPVKPIDLHREGDFSDTSLKSVDELLYPASNYRLLKGIFPRVNSEYVEYRTFSFVHLDVDIYDSVAECLEFFIPRMDKGGIIALDDYLEPNCPGAKLAADAIAITHGLKIEPTVQSQAIIRF